MEVTLNNQRCEIDFEILYPNDWGSKFIGNESIPIIILGVNFVVGDTDEGLDGHIHYNIDRNSNDLSDYSISFESSFDISFNSGGEHILKIWLVDNNHEIYLDDLKRIIKYIKNNNKYAGYLEEYERKINKLNNRLNKEGIYSSWWEDTKIEIQIIGQREQLFVGKIIETKYPWYEPRIKDVVQLND